MRKRARERLRSYWRTLLRSQLIMYTPGGLSMSRWNIDGRAARVDSNPSQLFRRPKIAVVDLKDLRRKMENGGPFEPAVYETWFANVYSKAHAVPTVSAHLLDAIPNNFQEERGRLLTVAHAERIDLLRILPAPRDFDVTENGITFFLEGDILMMGTNSAIERAWRQLSHRFP